MRAARIIGGLVVLSGVIGLSLRAQPAGAVNDVCVRRASTRTGQVGWQLRQASGLASVAASPGVLFTHNDRGLRDNPAGGEDTTNATVWAVAPSGKALARLRLVDGHHQPIPYFDTEAISRDPQGRLVLADTGTNVDGRTTVALYRFTPPAVSPDQAYVETDTVAEVIPLAYYANAKTSTKTKLNVEAVAIAPTGDAWFIPRKSGKPYAYVAPAASLDQAAAMATPARAVKSTQLKVAGPMTDASFSPDGSMLLVKSMKNVYAYPTAGSTVAAALGTTPCTVATASKAKDPGYGEAIVARDDGGFSTLAEASKNLHTGNASAIWSFDV